MSATDERIDRLEKLIEQLIDVKKGPSIFNRIGSFLRTYRQFLIGLVLGMVLAVPVAKIDLPWNLQRSQIERTAEREAAAIPFPERRAVADAYRLAADRIEAGGDRYETDEYVRKIVAVQESGEQWQRFLDETKGLVQFETPITYAAQLRKIAKGLER